MALKDALKKNAQAAIAWTDRKPPGPKGPARKPKVAPAKSLPPKPKAKARAPRKVPEKKAAVEPVSRVRVIPVEKAPLPPVKEAPKETPKTDAEKAADFRSRNSLMISTNASMSKRRRPKKLRQQ